MECNIKITMNNSAFSENGELYHFELARILENTANKIPNFDGWTPVKIEVLKSIEWKKINGVWMELAEHAKDDITLESLAQILR